MGGVAYFSALFKHFLKKTFGVRKSFILSGHRGEEFILLKDIYPCGFGSDVWKCAPTTIFFLNRWHTEPSMKSHMKGTGQSWRHPCKGDIKEIVNHWCHCACQWNCAHTLHISRMISQPSLGLFSICSTPAQPSFRVSIKSLFYLRFCLLKGQF
jgi:hypothetical protein